MGVGFDELAFALAGVPQGGVVKTYKSGDELTAEIMKRGKAGFLARTAPGATVWAWNAWLCRVGCSWCCGKASFLFPAAPDATVFL